MIHSRDLDWALLPQGATATAVLARLTAGEAAQQQQLRDEAVLTPEVVNELKAQREARCLAHRQRDIEGYVVESIVQQHNELTAKRAVVLQRRDLQKQQLQQREHQAEVLGAPWVCRSISPISQFSLEAVSRPCAIASPSPLSKQLAMLPPVFPLPETSARHPSTL